MIDSCKSVLKLEEFYFSDFSFTKKDSCSDYDDRDIKIGFSKEHKTDNGVLELKLAARVCFEEHFDLKLIAYGKFTISTSNENVESFVKNAIAILFPYIRSEITLLTSQPNMKPIILPPININAFFEQQDKQAT